MPVCKLCSGSSCKKNFFTSLLDNPLRGAYICGKCAIKSKNPLVAHALKISAITGAETQRLRSGEACAHMCALRDTGACPAGPAKLA